MTISHETFIVVLTVAVTAAVIVGAIYAKRKETTK
jgi:hypothetical protein